MTGHDIAMNIDTALALIWKQMVAVNNKSEYAFTLLAHARTYLTNQMNEAHKHAEEIWSN